MNFKQANEANYREERSGEIEYIVIHYTGNNGDTAKSNAIFFANDKIGASAHFFVDENEVWQSVKDEDTAWHCGTTKQFKHPACRNYNSLGVELCSRLQDGKYFFKEETVNNAVNLVRFLMDKYNIEVDHVIRHFDVTGKYCPAPFIDEGKWQEFLTRLEMRYNTVKEIPEWARADIQKLVDKGIISAENMDLSLDMVRMLVLNARMLQTSFKQALL